MDNFPSIRESSKDKREAATHWHVISIEFPNAEDLHGGFTQRQELEFREGDFPHCLDCGISLFITGQRRAIASRNLAA